jgi:uncharacterized protein
LSFGIELALFLKLKKIPNMKKLMLVSLLIAVVSANAFALKPSRKYSIMPDKYGMKYKEEKLKTPDGAEINTWYFECPKKSVNSIIISDDGDGNMADNLELINQFLSNGYNVLAYDYRGYGASSDFTIEPNMYIYSQFIIDLNTVADQMRRLKSITKFDFYGIGIGAGLSLGVGANRLETRRVIADGTWLSLEGMKAKYKEKRGTEIILPFGFDKTYEPLYAYEKPRAKNISIMIIVSPKDDLMNDKDMKQFKQATETFVVKNSPSNSENFSTDKNAYFEKIKKFTAD